MDRDWELILKVPVACVVETPFEMEIAVNSHHSFELDAYVMGVGRRVLESSICAVDSFESAKTERMLKFCTTTLGLPGEKPVA